MTPIYRSLQNFQFHHRRLESLEHFNVLFIYIHSEHYGLSFLDLTDVIFLQGLPFLYTFPFIYIYIAQSVSALDFNFERAVEGSILTAGKRLSLKI